MIQLSVGHSRTSDEVGLSDLAAKGIIIIENMPVGVLSDLAAKGIIIVSGIAR